MSSIALKFTSLAIRTLSKPIANYIKKQAREHEGFKQVCISFAQSLHRVDMRWRIGLLQDSASLERQAAREAAKKEAAKTKASTPTVKTEAETKAEKEATAKAAKEAAEEAKHNRPTPKIKPLSESKAIESGANFISETFLFSVAAGLILFESWRSRRKESTRREDVADRLNDLEESEQAARVALIELEREVLRLRAKEKGVPVSTITKRILPKEVYEPSAEENVSEEAPKGWFSGVSSLFQSKDAPDEEARQALATNSPGPAEKVLVQSDRILEEKRKQRAAAAASAGASPDVAKETATTSVTAVDETKKSS